ncbi:MAG: hypothetical protein JWQ40_1104 [Segetibacter sp.]|nr:hypothetical protein [Segetibacter sp.]
MSHYSKIENEQPVFIHPANEECETFITFREEIPIAGNGNERGIENISKLRLDGELLNEQRRKTFNMIRDIYDLAIGYPDTYPDLQQQARNLVNRYLHESQSDKTEYASMLRAFFRDNPPSF